MLDQVPHPAVGFELEEIEGEMLLYSPASTRSVYLNTTASLIWKLCDGQQTVSQIVTQLRDAFPDAAESIEADVTRSIALFVENDAIRLQSTNR